MKHSEAKAIQASVADILAAKPVSVTSVELSDWSRVYTVVQSDGGRVFAKGVPRTRSEAYVTSVLGAVCPQHVPHLLHLDLMPENEAWQWFLIADAGKVMNDNVTVDEAAQTVFALGRIQRAALEVPDLAQKVPNCESERFLDIVHEIIDWAVMDMPEKGMDLRSIGSTIASSSKLNRAVGILSGSSTCVHGDLWYGNVALSVNGAVLLDWADTLWGPGGISVLNFLWTAEGELDPHEAELWRAWGEGIGTQPTTEYIWACKIALYVTSLVIDREIALCCGKSASWLTGLVPGFNRLARVLSE